MIYVNFHELKLWWFQDLRAFLINSPQFQPTAHALPGSWLPLGCKTPSPCGCCEQSTGKVGNGRPVPNESIVSLCFLWMPQGLYPSCCTKPIHYDVNLLHPKEIVGIYGYDQCDLQKNLLKTPFLWEWYHRISQNTNFWAPGRCASDCGSWPCNHKLVIV